MDKKAKQKLWERFEELSLNVTDGDVKTSTEYLSDLGVDAKEESEFGLREIGRLHFMAQAHSNQARDKNLMEKLKIKIAEAVERNKQLAGEILQRAVIEKKPSFQFRNIEKWSDEEMRDVLSDLDIAKLLEDLDKME